MYITLYIPGQEPQALRWTEDHALSSYGCGILLDVEDQPIEGGAFRLMRDIQGARIDTDDPALVRRALRMTSDETLGA